MKANKVTIRQRGWLGSFDLHVNGAQVAEVVSVEYSTGVDQAPVVVVGILADDVEIELPEGCEVLLLPRDDIGPQLDGVHTRRRRRPPPSTIPMDEPNAP